MSQEFVFDNEEEMVVKLKELQKKGHSTHDLTLISPYPIHGLDETLGEPNHGSVMKFFTLVGASSGCLIGLALTCYTMFIWPINTSGKPFISMPPFFVIMFELTILLGALVSFAGFLFLTRLPNPFELIPEKEYGNKFVIVLEDK